MRSACATRSHSMARSSPSIHGMPPPGTASRFSRAPRARRARSWRSTRATGAAGAELALLDRAVRSAPESADLRLEYATVLERQGELEGAERQLTDVCRRRPDSAALWQ